MEFIYQALLFTTLLNGILSAVVSKNGCTINPLQTTKSPILVKSNETDFIYPEAHKKSLTFSSGETVDFICPGSKVKISSSSKGSVVTATCVEDETFTADGKQVKWSEVSCTGNAKHIAKYNDKTCATAKGKEIEVGFDTGDDRFLSVYIICWNTKTQEALYSYHTVTLDIEEETSEKRPTWKQVDEFYTVGSATSYYDRNNQRTTINSLLGLSKTSKKYVQDGDDYFMSRGHMNAKGDNFYPIQQDATFLMMNVAPQWQTFNGGNWEKVESSVRKYAEDNNVDIEVYTGVYGVATLPHSSTGKETELWLYLDENDNKALPVPEIYWKVAYDASNQKGVAIIGVNNPYISDYKKICTDVSDKLSWISWDKDNQAKGFGYACEFDEFKKVVDFVPTLSVKGLLQ